MNKNGMRIFSLFGVVCLCFLGCQKGEKYQGRYLSSWITDLDSSTYYKKLKACEVLGDIGLPAEKAVADIVKLVGEGDERLTAVATDALGKLGEKGIGALEPLLSETDAQARFHASVAILKNKAQHTQAAKVLVALVTSVGNAEIAKTARESLRRLGASVAVPLSEALKDEYLPVKLQVIGSLGEMKTKARSAVPKLQELMTHKEKKVRQATLKALASIGPREAVEQTFRDALKDAEEEVRITAAMMLKYIGARESASGNEGVPEEPIEDSAKK
jgi:HEAT repeat protein